MLKNFVLRHVLPAVNIVLEKARLKLTPVGRPNRDFDAFIRHVGRLGVKFETVIDVGIAQGSPFLYRAIPKAKYYLIEPVPSCAPLLKELTRTLNAEAFNVAAGATDGTLDFYVHSDVSGSSAYEQAEGKILDGTKVTVPVRRLDTLVPGDIARPCLLKIDTQGAELEVLAGLGDLAEKMDVILIEASFHQFRKGIPEIDEIIAKMIEMGFRCYDVLEGEYRVFDGALAQVDLAFVPANSKLRETAAMFSPAQADAYSAAYK